jgi:Flp pilus assembly protein TadG
VRRRLFGDTRGAALIEFALTLPVLLLMGLGGLETAEYGIACLRVSQIAMTTADNAGRVRNQITEADINELMTGAKFVGQSIDFANNGRIILSSLEPNGQTQASGKKGYMIRWQRCTGKMAVTSAYGTEGTGTNDATLKGMGPDSTKLLVPADGTAVMYVEVSYTYQPVVASRWINQQTIKAERAFNVRQRTDQVLKPGGVADADIAKCTKYTA